MKNKVSKEREIKGNWNEGSPALIPSPPLATIKERTVSVSNSPKMTTKETTTIAVRAAGIFFVSMGKNIIMSMVTATNPIIVYKETPCNHSPWLLNIPSWDIKITIAKPFTKPIITG